MAEARGNIVKVRFSDTEMARLRGKLSASNIPTMAGLLRDRALQDLPDYLDLASEIGRIGMLLNRMTALNKRQHATLTTEVLRLIFDIRLKIQKP